MKNNIAIETYKELSLKRTSFLSNISSIETLVVGSSHGDYCFDPSLVPNSFNFCHASQDLLRSLRILEYAYECGAVIRNVICFFSVFSPGFELQCTSERARIAAYNYLFGTNDNADDDIVSAAYSSIAFEGDIIETNAEQFYKGFVRSNKRFYIKDKTMIQRRLEKHLMFNKMSGSMSYLDSIIKFTRHHGQNLLVVIPPVQVQYRNYMPPFDSLFGSLPRDEFSLLDLFSSSNNIADDSFGDTDHMLPLSSGVKVVAERINESLNFEDLL